MNATYDTVEQFIKATCRYAFVCIKRQGKTEYFGTVETLRYLDKWDEVKDLPIDSITQERQYIVGLDDFCDVYYIHT